MNVSIFSQQGVKFRKKLNGWPAACAQATQDLFGEMHVLGGIMGMKAAFPGKATCEKII